MSVKIFSEVNTSNIECLRFLKAYSLLCPWTNFKNNEFPRPHHNSYFNETSAYIYLECRIWRYKYDIQGHFVVFMTKWYTCIDEQQYKDKLSLSIIFIICISTCVTEKITKRMFIFCICNNNWWIKNSVKVNLCFKYWSVLSDFQKWHKVVTSLECLVYLYYGHNYSLILFSAYLVSSVWVHVFQFGRKRNFDLHTNNVKLMETFEWSE